MPHYLSLSGGSGLSMQTLLTCPKKFQLIMDGWQPTKTELYFVEGIVMHKYAEQVMMGHEVDEAKIREIFNKGEFKDENKDDIIKFDAEELGTKDQTKAYQAGERILRSLSKLSEVRKTGKFGTIGEENIEKLIEINLLIDPLTQKPDDEAERIRDNDIIYTARLDLVNEVGVQDYKQCKISNLKENDREIIKKVGHLKQFGKYNAQKAFQLTEYGYFETIQSGFLVEDVYYHLFSKHEDGCEYVPLHGTRTAFDYHNAFDALKYAGKKLLQCEKEGYEREGMIRCDCKEQYGNECRYWIHCREGIDLKDAKELENKLESRNTG